MVKSWYGDVLERVVITVVEKQFNRQKFNSHTSVYKG